MTSKTLSQLPEAGPLSGEELVFGVQDGLPVHIKTNNIIGVGKVNADAATAAATVAAQHKNEAAASANASAVYANNSYQTAGNSIAARVAEIYRVRDDVLKTWTSASSALETLPMISKNIHSGNIIKSLIYDTAKDSDGGAWRKRMADESWYNETIYGGWLGQQKDELIARGDNLITHSEEFTNAAWTKASCTILSDVVVAPDGTLTADKIVEGTVATTGCGVAQNKTVSPGGFVGTVYLKAAERNFAVIYMDNGGGLSMSYRVNLTTGAISQVKSPNPIWNSSAYAVATLENNGFWKVGIYGVTTATMVGLRIFSDNNSTVDGFGIPNYTGDGVSGIYVWGAKLNAYSYDANKTNRELIINGDFSAGVAGWTSAAGTSMSSVNGALRVSSDTGTVAYQSFPTAIGKTYILKATLIGVNQAAYFKVGTSIAGMQYGELNSTSGKSGVSQTSTFVATSTTTYISTNPSIAVGGYADFDDISVKEVTVFATPYIPNSRLVNSYYQNTTDGKFYALNSTFGQTEVFRGNSREFPALVAVVVETSRVIIYDVTQPDAPMWMVFIAINNSLVTRLISLRCIALLNGEMVLGGQDGVMRINFAADTITWIHQSITSNTGLQQNNISLRNIACIQKTKLALTIVGLPAHELATTILPDAPINPSTGLQTPTVAVTTDGGISIIKHDGIVANHAFSGMGADVLSISGKILRYKMNSASHGHMVYDLSKLTGTTFIGTLLSAPTLLMAGYKVLSMDETTAVSYSQVNNAVFTGMAISKENITTLSKSMRANIAAAYPGMWQVGDSRGAWLCHSIAETITESGELVTNGTFTPDTTGWTLVGDGSMDVSSGQLIVTRGNAVTRASQGITTTIGKMYQFDWTAATGTAGPYVYLSSSNNGGADIMGGDGRAGAFSYMFIATSAMTYINLSNNGGSLGSTSNYDNISVKEILGLELVTNGTNPVDVTGWGATPQGTFTVSNGEFATTNTTGGDIMLQTISGLVVGKEYEISAVARCGTSTSIGIYGYPNPHTTAYPTTTQTTNTNLSLRFIATATTQNIYVTASVGTAFINKISVRDTQNFILNGKFDVDTTGWSASKSTLSVVSNAVRVTNTAGDGSAYQVINTVVGRTYRLQFNLKAKSHTSGIRVYQGISSNLDSWTLGGLGTLGVYTYTFVATSSAVTIFFANYSAVVGATSDFDDIELRDITELVTNGRFEGMTTGWSTYNGVDMTTNNGAMRLTVTSVQPGSAQTTLTNLVVGRSYILSWTKLASNTGTNNYEAHVTTAPLVAGQGYANLTGSAVGVRSNYTFIALASTMYLAVQPNASVTVGQYVEFDSISVRLAEPDRSVINMGLVVKGSIIKAPVASGAQLMAYSGFSSSNYLEQPYQPNLDFGTGDFCVMGWINNASADAFSRTILRRGGTTNATPFIRFDKHTDNGVLFSFGDGTNSASLTTGALPIGSYSFVCGVRRGTLLELYVNDALIGTTSAASVGSLSNALAVLKIGYDPLYASFIGSTTLFRMGVTAPSADQIAYIFRTELALFQSGAKCTIDGTSPIVTAMAYDEETEVLHVGTSWGRSAFRGLMRVESSATSVGSVQSISAAGGAHITAGVSSGRFHQPSLVMRDKLRYYIETKRSQGRIPVSFDFDIAANATTISLPKGFTCVYQTVSVNGSEKRPGVGKDYVIENDGFVETIRFAVAPVATGTAWVRIKAVRN